MTEYYYDVDNIRSIWRQFQVEFGRLYPGYIEEQCASNRFICCKIDGVVAGVASYSIKNTKKEVVIDIIATLPLYRGRGVAKQLIKRIYSETESLYFNLGFRLKVEEFEESINHAFWDKLSESKVYHVSPSGKTKSFYYYLDLHKISSM